jgi:hypothetical protein
MQLSIGFSSFELGTQAVQALVVFIGWADLGAWRGLIPTCSDGRPSDQGLQAANHGSGGKGSSECSWLSIAGASGASAASMIRWDQKLLPGASVAHQWWPSGAVLNVDSRISEDCEAFILGTPHGLRVFFVWRCWEFFLRLLLVRLEKDMVAPVSSFAAQDGSSTSGQRRPGFCIMPRAV